MSPFEITQKMPIMRPTNGLVILGSELKCGKTVLMAGLAATMREQGFPMRAIKPIILGPRKNSDAEISFISSVSRTASTYHREFLEHPGPLNDQAWLNTISSIHTCDDTTLIELPGGTSTPVSYEDSDDDGLAPRWRDSAELACELDLPCLLVARHASDSLEKLVVHASYMKLHKLRIVGLITVETEPGLGREIESRMKRAAYAMAILQRTQLPYLGCIKHSPSVSVSGVHQGNLIKLIQNGLDLVALLKSLNLTVSV